MGSCSQPALRRPERGVVKALDMVQDLGALTSAQDSERRAGPKLGSVLKGDGVSSRGSKPPRGPLGGAAPTPAVDIQSVCTGTATLVTKISTCFKTSC